MNKEVMFSSKSDEYATPQGLYDLLNKEFCFDLDPCSTDENCKCAVHYTKADNGLEKNWGGAECFAIPHIATFPPGLKNVTEKGAKTIPWSLC